jgi:hypothetical protein
VRDRALLLDVVGTFGDRVIVGAHAGMNPLRQCAARPLLAGPEAASVCFVDAKREEPGLVVGQLWRSSTGSSGVGRCEFVAIGFSRPSSKLTKSSAGPANDCCRHLGVSRRRRRTSSSKVDRWLGEKTPSRLQWVDKGRTP